MVCILGFLPENETSDYQLTKFTNHAQLRKYRFDLINTFNVLYYFEVYRFKDKSRQIHCLLEDSSIVIYNKKSKEVITVILADRDLLNKYINNINLEQKILSKLSKCARLNKKFDVNEKELSEEDIKEYMERKHNILSIM